MSNAHPKEALPDLKLERLSPLRRAFKRGLLNPLANYLPAGLMKAGLRFGKSQLAAANWKDPGGYRSMVICYDGQVKQPVDRMLIHGGTMPMALRNRKRLGSHLLAELIRHSPQQPAHVLCLGCGPGQIILDALERAGSGAHATLVDLNAEALEFGRDLAHRRGLAARVRHIHADVRDLPKYLDKPPHVVKMLGICEYLTDDQVVMIAQAAANVMPAGAAIVFNSLSKAHGTDRFFRRVFGLHMRYRTARQLEALMAQAGFGDFQAHTEPLGVYDVIVGRKVATG